MFRTEGGRLLQAALDAEGLTQGQLRKQRPGSPVASGMICRWISGEQNPDADNRVWLFERFAIPLRAWGESPKTEAAE